MEDGIERKWLTLSQREMFQFIDINHVQMENLEKLMLISSRKRISRLFLLTFSTYASCRFVQEQRQIKHRNTWRKIHERFAKDSRKSAVSFGKGNAPSWASSRALHEEKDQRISI